jgi:probable phosphoglycerate mutase
MAAWLKASAAAPPGGERLSAAARRVLPALGRVLDAQRGATVVVVSHVTPMKIVLRHALLAPPPAVRRMHLDVASMCEIDWHDEGLGVVRTFNDTAHLHPREWAVSTYAEERGG